MSAVSDALAPGRSRPYRAILWGWLIAGTLDITAAFITSAFYGRGPVLLLQGIASGLIGDSASRGGLATAALGLALHYFIAFVWTVVFYAASRKLKFMVRQPVIWGLLYGVVVYFVMNFIVLPFTFPGRITHPLGRSLIAAATLMVCIGLPVALVTRAFSTPSES